MATSIFESLPRFDARDFDPPAWARSEHLGRDQPVLATSTSTEPDASSSSANVDDIADSDDEDGDEQWQDAVEVHGEGADPWDAVFSTAELQALLDKAMAHKASGNASFTSIPPDHVAAIDAYKVALKALPDCSKVATEAAGAKSGSVQSGIQEVTEEEADAIQAEATTIGAGSEQKARDEVEEQIRECTKACWGNLAASYLAKGDNKEAVDACSQALAIDPDYTKGLQRRATANDRIGSWSSLTSAQDDYNHLLRLIPSQSAQARSVRHDVATLPERIRIQQEKEKDEMLGKLKDLGNGLLGKFGLSTDMFKFDQQDGGGYSMRFER